MDHLLDVVLRGELSPSFGQLFVASRNPSLQFDDPDAPVVVGQAVTRQLIRDATLSIHTVSQRVENVWSVPFARRHVLHEPFLLQLAAEVELRAVLVVGLFELGYAIA
ncbi:MAG TPA: hypothetical protein VNZ26_34370 [Vicinamibacterales bacterium]|nr:hypothetical protein [Vicinamibacterales bacterium]